MMIESFIKGLMIGLAVAVAVGPIALLCIQRTLTHGFKVVVTVPDLYWRQMMKLFVSSRDQVPLLYDCQIGLFTNTYLI